MKILAVSSGKGGVGKTTVTLNLARQLSLAGFRTLLIDFDIHNKGATCLFMDKVEQSEVHSVMSIMGVCCTTDCDLTRAFTEKFSILDLGYDDKLYMIPAARPDEMVEWKKFVCETHIIVDFFRAFIQTLAEEHHIDVVLIDCYGGVDTLTISAAGVADDFIIINEPDVITFAGTLLLYKQLETTYGAAERKPRVHFVINRISGRYSFRFLQQEYERHLSQLAVDREVLAYLPFDKLVFDNFGDYPFFSELLPKGLYAKKIRELIARLWPEPQFLRLTARSQGEREKIYESTAENPYADPERIFQVWKTAPGWALLPITALILLFSLGATRTISYFTLRATFYISLLFVVAVALLTVLFEPAQITRWLLRKSAYERYRRRVLTGPTIASRARAVWSYLLSLMPAGIGVICFSTILLIAIGLDLFYPFRNLAIWRGQIGGLHSGGHYEKLQTADFASLAPQSDLSSSYLSGALMSKTLLPNIKLTGARIDNATLDSAEMIGNQLRGAVLKESSLRSADLSASDAAGADFSYADCQNTKFQAADLSNANFTSARFYLADFRHSNLKGAQFNGAIIKDTKFDGAVLTEADFRGADFTYIDNDNRSMTFSILAHGGALLSKEQQDLAKDWEATPPRIGQLRWWLNSNPQATPAHFKDFVDPRIHTLTEQLADQATGTDSQTNEFATRSDLIELLLIRGTDQDLNRAREELKRLSPDANVNDKRVIYRNQGVKSVLQVLLSILSHDADEQANLENWRDWLQGNHQRSLDGWSWDTWDNSFPASNHSQEQNAQVRVIRLSATQELRLTPNQMMMWFPDFSTTMKTSTATK